MTEAHPTPASGSKRKTDYQQGPREDKRKKADPPLVESASESRPEKIYFDDLSKFTEGLADSVYLKNLDRAGLSTETLLNTVARYGLLVYSIFIFQFRDLIFLTN